MKSRSLMSLVPLLSSDILVVLVFLLGATLLTAGLIPVSELTNELIDSANAVKIVADQQRNLTAISSGLDALRERLDSHGDVQGSVDQLRDSDNRLEAALRAMTVTRPAGWFALTGDTGATKPSIAGAHTPALRQSFAALQPALTPLLEPRGSLYEPGASAVAILNENGLRFDHGLTDAIRVSHKALPELNNELAVIGSELQGRTAVAAGELRLVMLVGLLVGGLLVGFVMLLLSARRLQDVSLRAARQQTTDILRTVKDGLFLLDRNLVIGSTYSAALETLFQRRDLAGLPFESLLQNVVSAKSLATALKFVRVLWLERTNEKLVKSINPLGEVEVHFDTGDGKFDTRFLQFEFHRVRVDGRITQILVVVSDVSSRVELARELQASQSKAQAQLDTLLGILHLDPMQLASFLSDANASLTMINAVMREPAREESAFRKKLDTLFRQAHAVKGEAAALGLTSIESRAHSLEDDLKVLRDKAELSGGDFLPLVIKLDDLMTHLQSVTDVVTRLSALQPSSSEARRSSAAAAGSAAGAGRKSGGDTASLRIAGDAGLSATLQQLAARIAGEQHKSVNLELIGMDAVPAEYRRVVKDAAIQGVRNAIVHGIESPALRLSVGKAPQGQVRLSFKNQGDAGYRLLIEDDGQGLAVERIKEVALQKGLITPEQAAELTSKQMYGLLFQPGFSTLSAATPDAGRGVGMNLIADLIREVGGRVGIATAEGKYLRLALSLPLPGKPAIDGNTAVA